MHVEKCLRTRAQPKRSEALYFIPDYGLRGSGENWETAIQAVLSEHTVFVVKTLLVNLKDLLPNHSIFTIHTLRLVVVNKISIERPHWDEDFRLKGEERWGWTFNLFLYAEGTCISLWNKESNKITHFNIPFGCVLLKRSDVTKVG